jgi:hypothetical protein
MLLAAGSIVPAPARWAWVAGLPALALLRFRVTPRGRGERAAALGLGLAVLYVGLMTGASRLAAARVRAELRRQGIAGVEDLMVGPEPADPLSWDVVAALPAEYRHGKFRWLPTPALDLAPRAIPTGMAGAGVAAALGAPGIQGTLGWMRFPFVEVEESATGTTVYLLDARYVRGRTRGFGAAVIETAPGGVSWLHPRAEGRHAR